VSEAGTEAEVAAGGGGTGTVRAAVGMGAITAVSRVVGFLRVLVVAAVLGIGALGDAFQSANSLSNVLFELLAAGALSAVLVPAFVRLLDAGDQTGAEEVAGGVLGLALVGLGALVAVGVLAAPALAWVLTHEAGPEQRELVTFLLRLFLPQVVLYAAGTVATGVLYAKRRFLATAAAPIGNTVVMVASLALFRVVAGDDPRLEDITTGERWLLVAAGTGGVVAFVGILLVACRASGFRLRPRWPGRDPRVAEVGRAAGWGVVLHSCAGAILGGAIVAGSGVDGSVVAYQTAWVFFLAPYGILAQPIHTAILPELVTEAGDGDLDRFRTSVRWALERMALTILPVAVALAALGGPAMRIVAATVDSTGDGDAFLGAALATLALGLFPYSAFLLLARAYYALDDSRTPGLVSLAVAAVGLVVLAVGAPLTESTARVTVMGLAHSSAYLVGVIALLVGLSRRVGGSILPRPVVVMSAAAAATAVVVWFASDRLLSSRTGLLADAVVAGGLTLVGAAGLFAAYRVTGIGDRLTRRDGTAPGDGAVDAVVP
jgi:putative peptidoglycan lipid II flippase